MPLPTFYDTGTASVANGATAITGSATGWKGRIYAGDMFYDPAQPLVPPQRIAADATGDALTLAVAWPGTSLVGAAYEILITPDSVRVQERTRQLLEQMSVVEANGRGLFYLFATATADADPGAGYLRFNNATIGSATAAYLDNVDANGGTVATILDSWDDNGATGGRGQLWVRSVAAPSTFHAFNVTGSVVDGTGYRKLTLAYIGGSGSLLADDELMVDFVPVGAAGANGANGTNGVDGKFSGTEVIKIAAYTALAADVGKTIILNKATADTLSFDPAATLGATWMVMLKNIGAGTWTLDPNGSETINGVATVTLLSGQSVVVASNGTLLRTFFAGGIGGSTGSTDNRMLRSDGTGGATIQDSAITVDDSGNISGLGTISSGGAISSGEANRAFNLIDVNAVMRVWRFQSLSSGGPSVELVHGTGATAGDSANTWWDFFTLTSGGTPGTDRFGIRRRTGGAFSELISLDGATGLCKLFSLGLGAPVTKTADFTVAATENYLINNKSGSTCTVTLPTASSWTGRIIKIKNIQAQTVVSASSNVVPLSGGAAGTAILSANAGRWAELVSNGTNWEIVTGVI